MNSTSIVRPKKETRDERPQRTIDSSSSGSTGAEINVRKVIGRGGAGIVLLILLFFAVPLVGVTLVMEKSAGTEIVVELVLSVVPAVVACFFLIPKALSQVKVEILRIVLNPYRIAIAGAESTSVGTPEVSRVEFKEGSLRLVGADGGPLVACPASLTTAEGEELVAALGSALASLKSRGPGGASACPGPG